LDHERTDLVEKIYHAIELSESAKFAFHAE